MHSPAYLQSAMAQLAKEYLIQNLENQFTFARSLYDFLHAFTQTLLDSPANEDILTKEI